MGCDNSTDTATLSYDGLRINSTARYSASNVSLSPLGLRMLNSSGSDMTQVKAGSVKCCTDGGNKWHELSEKANTSDVLTKTNSTEFTPTADYQPATKKYVDNITSSFVSGKVTTITVPTTGWTTSRDTNGTTYYSINITDSILTSTGYPITDVVLPNDIAAARLQSEAYQNVNKITVNDGSVTLYCFDSLPTVSFQIRIQLLYI